MKALAAILVFLLSSPALAQVRKTTQRDISYSTDKQNKIIVTHVGASGPATFSGDTLNIPNYVAGSAPGTVTEIIAGHGLVPDTIDTAGRIDMANVGTAGTYGDSTHTLRIVTDSLGRVISATVYNIGAKYAPIINPAFVNPLGDTAVFFDGIGGLYLHGSSGSNLQISGFSNLDVFAPVNMYSNAYVSGSRVLTTLDSAAIAAKALAKADSNTNGGAVTYYYSQGHYVQLGSHYNNPSWLDSLAFAKIAGMPAYIRRVDLSASAPLTYNNTTGVFAIDSNNATTGGYLTPYRFGLYNGKQDALSGTGFAKFSGSSVSYVPLTSQLHFNADGQGGVVAVGASQILRVTMAGTMTDWYLDSSPAITGSVAILIKKNGVSITGGTQPNLSAATSNSGTTSSWSATTFSAGDVFTFSITSATAITGFNLTIKFTK